MNAAIKVKPISAGKVSVSIDSKTMATAYVYGKVNGLVEFSKPDEKAWFAGLTQSFQDSLKELIRTVERYGDTIIADADGNILEQKYVQPVSTSNSGPSLKSVKKISKAQQWDNIHNEGGEGYNPYRY